MESTLLSLMDNFFNFFKWQRKLGIFRMELNEKYNLPRLIKWLISVVITLILLFERSNSTRLVNVAIDSGILVKLLFLTINFCKNIKSPILLGKFNTL